MKTDRLYAITVYLLNHGKVPASELAKKFEVSVRTVQRDMDALCRAGIPIVSETGVSGGYSLTDTFHLDRHIATQKDYSFILTALKGFSTAMNDPKIDATLEKLTAVSKEVVIYRWYAWYLLAYSTVKDDYRTYKLVRMRNAEIIEMPFTKEHDSAKSILHSYEKNTQQPCTVITVRCKPEVKVKAAEYLNGKIIREYQSGECEMELHVIESETLWFGFLLS